VTVSTISNRFSYAGNGVSTAFAFSAYFQAQSDLAVILTTIADGTQVVQTLNSDYTISGTTDSNGFYPDGGAVNFSVAPPSTKTVTIYRDPPATQTTEFVDNDSLPAATLEAVVDKQTTVVQRVKDLITRALRQPDGDSAAIGVLPAKVDRANSGNGSYLGFDANGDPVVFAVANSGTSVPVSVAMAPVVEGSTLAVARTAMGLATIASTGAYNDLATKPPVPTQQRITASGTYTTPANCRSIRVRIVGPGGGGAGSGTSGGNNGSNGAGASTFIGTGVGLSAALCSGGVNSGTSGSGGAGTVSGANVTSSWSVTGNAGGAGGSFINTQFGPAGAPGPFGGAGAGGADAAANSGAGGGGGIGAGGGTDNIITGGAGGAGAYIEALINNPSATYTVTLPAGGAGGAAGTSGGAGGAGGSGVVIIDEFY
jgi:hypothetical protein